MRCTVCPYDEGHKICPCVYKTVYDIQRIEERKHRKKEKRRRLLFQNGYLQVKKISKKIRRI